jgi:putative FmdB family regulatory protein
VKTANIFYQGKPFSLIFDRERYDKKDWTMPVYEYEHLENPCKQGCFFEVNQSIRDPVLTQCPVCGGAVRKVISCIHIRMPKTNSELRDIGFTKLVKRDNGVYENVTAREGDCRIVFRDKPDTLPDLKKTIKD